MLQNMESCPMYMCVFYNTLMQPANILYLFELFFLCVTSAMMRVGVLSRTAAIVLCLLGCNVWEAVTKTLQDDNALNGRQLIQMVHFIQSTCEMLCPICSSCQLAACIASDNLALMAYYVLTLDIYLATLVSFSIGQLYNVNVNLAGFFSHETIHPLSLCGCSCFIQPRYYII